MPLEIKNTQNHENRRLHPAQKRRFKSSYTHTVSSGHLGLCSTFCSIQWFYQRTTKALIRQRRCADWSWSLLSAYAQRQIFARRGRNNMFECVRYHWGRPRWLSWMRVRRDQQVAGSTPPGRQHSLVEIWSGKFSTVIRSLPLIQEGQLWVSGKRKCTIPVNRLED